MQAGQPDPGPGRGLPPDEAGAEREATAAATEAPTEPVAEPAEAAP